MNKLLLAIIAAAILSGCAYPAYLRSDPPTMEDYINCKCCKCGGYDNIFDNKK